MWGYIVFAAVIGAAGGWIIRPLLSGKDRVNAYTSSPENLLEQLTHKKEGAYAAIRELQFDLHMGKLSAEDFQNLKRQYMQEAAGYLKASDDLQFRQAERASRADKDIEEEIEREVASLRRQKAKPGRFVYCAVCGQKAVVDDNFCGGCGSKLKKDRIETASR